mmetsp:Transcript_4568/g.19446  ORF Transcript_4568/g.19446 Transcript_4568/m.19446 type:complete len:284 (-) Transcript_4568:403-1254(-)
MGLDSPANEAAVSGCLLAAAREVSEGHRSVALGGRLCRLLPLHEPPHERVGSGSVLGPAARSGSARRFRCRVRRQGQTPPGRPVGGSARRPLRCRAGDKRRVRHAVRAGRAGERRPFLDALDDNAGLGGAWLGLVRAGLVLCAPRGLASVNGRADPPHVHRHHLGGDQVSCGLVQAVVNLAVGARPDELSALDFPLAEPARAQLRLGACQGCLVQATIGLAAVVVPVRVVGVGGPGRTDLSRNRAGGLAVQLRTRLVLSRGCAPPSRGQASPGVAMQLLVSGP